MHVPLPRRFANAATFGLAVGDCGIALGRIDVASGGSLQSPNTSAAIPHTSSADFKTSPLSEGAWLPSI